MHVDCATIDSPLGPLFRAWGAKGLRLLSFGEHGEWHRRALERQGGAGTWRTAKPPAEVMRSLAAYFGGEITALDGLDVDLAGTPFQRRVWAALRRIPAGQTASYIGLAAEVGCPGGARAVGAANGANPVAIVVPCHRVVRADGSLCGYGGGVWRKEWLLRHEGVLAAAAARVGEKMLFDCGVAEA